MELKDKKVVVIGSGVSGVGCVKLLSKTDCQIIWYDGNEALSPEDVLKKAPGTGKITAITGILPDEVTESADLAVISPGVPIDSEIVMKFKNAGVPVWGEIELAYNYERGRVFAITGTNGKTTTTTLTGLIMKNYNEKTFVVGNIGNSYPAEALNTSPDSYTVAEISSFQLESIHDFAPEISAILNITPDHLNRHYTMENYIAVKESITKNQKQGGICVLNYDDEVLRKFGETLENPVYFSRKIIPENGAFLRDSIIGYSRDGEITEIVNVNDMHIFGNHNYENVMAAVAITINAGIPVDIISETIKSFKGVEHRIEYVRTLDGVKYYNDSKGTNPDSSIKALESMSAPTILIAGGYDKHSEFDSFIEAFDNKVKLLVLIGQTAEQIAECAKKHGFTNIVYCDNLKEAVEQCHHSANEGDVVLLSPACASWGMFKNFEERGNLFKDYVNQL